METLLVTKKKMLNTLSVCGVNFSFTYIAGNMSALLGMQDRNSIRPHIVSLGDIFQPLLLVVTLWIGGKMLGQYFMHSRCRQVICLPLIYFADKTASNFDFQLIYRSLASLTVWALNLA